MTREINIQGRRIGLDHPSFIIAEIGINHNGSFDLAKKLIRLAVDAGADCVKFQMRDMGSLYTNSGNADDIKENLSTQYILDLLSKFQLTNEQMFACFDYCKQLDVIPLCTPWDISTLQNLNNYGIPAYKIASADLTNHDLLEAVLKTGKPIICSTGMSYQKEIEESVQLLTKYSAEFALLHCNSTYPPHAKDIHLSYLTSLSELGDCVVGYSGHERGYHVPIAAVAMGARIIEKHFTIDRNMEGSDHKVSLLPEEFKKMVRYIRETELALGTHRTRIPNQGELMNRVNLSKSLVINCDLEKGQTIENHMLEVKSPGRGLQPNYRQTLVSRKAKRDFRAGDFFFQEDIQENGQYTARNYSFRRKWGIPVRYHDFVTLSEKSNPDFLEFHLSYKDMDQDFTKFFTEPSSMGLVVHSPDTFSGDHLLNLASTDSTYRKRSINELQRVVDLTNGLKKYLTGDATPLIVVSVGGFSNDSFFNKEEKIKAYGTVADSLSQINQNGVKIIPQTLPPFPWYFGGQLFCNLFVHPEDTAWFCETYGYNICFDISHSKLASNHYKIPFEKFTDTIGKYASHLHVVDARGLDGEGLQIDEGEVDFEALSEQLNLLTPNASFIPEIWMGHENEGEKQWVALERLEKYAF